MTHYMELLDANQPWNLIIFMLIPVAMAEYLVISEFYLLFTKKLDSWVYRASKYVGIAAGVYFAGIIIHLTITAVIPITLGGQWRTIIDIVAVFGYLLGGLPLIYIALQELNLINKNKEPMEKLKIHAICISIFLILAHIAMVAGMLSPALLGWAPDSMANMHHH